MKKYNIFKNEFEGDLIIRIIKGGVDIGIRSVAIGLYLLVVLVVFGVMKLTHKE